MRGGGVIHTLSLTGEVLSVCVHACVSSEVHDGYTGRKVPAAVPAVALLHLLTPVELKSRSSQKAPNADTSACLQLLDVWKEGSTRTKLLKT